MGAHHIGLDALDRRLRLRLCRRGFGLDRRRRLGLRLISLAPGLGRLALGFLCGGALGLFLGPLACFLGLLDAADLVVALGFLERLEARRLLARGQVGEMRAILGAELGGGEAGLLVGRHLHLAAGARGVDALALDLDGDGLGPAMGEGLLDLPAVDGLAQLKLAPGSEAERLLGLGFVARRHLGSCLRRTASPSLCSRIPSRRPTSRNRRAAMPPGARLAWTTPSWPSAADRVSLSNSATTGTGGLATAASVASLARPSAAPSLAARSNPARPAFRSACTFSKPVRTTPARLARPRSPRQR